MKIERTGRSEKWRSADAAVGLVCSLLTVACMSTLPPRTEVAALPESTSTVFDRTAARDLEMTRLRQEMINKIKRFLLERPRDVNEIISLFQIKNTNSTVVNNYGMIVVYGTAAFPLRKNEPNSFIKYDEVSKLVFDFSLDFDWQSHLNDRKSESCVDPLELEELVLSLNYERKIRLRHKRAEILYVEKLDGELVDGIKIDYEVDRPCVKGFAVKTGKFIGFFKE
jgi:hypothetical protein